MPIPLDEPVGRGVKLQFQALYHQYENGYTENSKPKKEDI
jgi:hypothetical protein